MAAARLDPARPWAVAPAWVVEAEPAWVVVAAPEWAAEAVPAWAAVAAEAADNRIAKKWLPEEGAIFLSSLNFYLR